MVDWKIIMAAKKLFFAQFLGIRMLVHYSGKFSGSCSSLAGILNFNHAGITANRLAQAVMVKGSFGDTFS